MPETLSELFNGGLVTARHAALLKPGELQRTDDCVYREKDPAIWRAPGRTKLNAVALGTVWAGSASGVKGLAHLTFEKTRFDQLLSYNGTVLARSALSASNAGVIDAIDLQVTATTTLNSTALTSSAQFGSVLVGWLVIGTGIAPGTTVITVTDSSNIVLSRNATANGTVTVTFNPTIEMAGPGQVAGTVSGTTTFTASTGFPFTQDVIGMQVYQFTDQSCRVIDVSGQSASTGHYNVVTLSAALSNGAATLLFQGGVVQAFQNNGTTDETIDLAQYGGSYFVWTGRGPIQRIGWRKRSSVTVGSENVALDDTLMTRPCGLLPVVTQPTVVQTANALYSWPATLSPGYYWFLCTEIFDPDGDSATEIESAYYGKTKDTNLKGEPVPVSIPALTGYGATITFPDRVNTGADGRISTHWGVYMYGPTADDKAMPSLAAFRRVAKVRMTANSGQTLLLQEASSVQTKAPTATTPVGTIPQMTSPNNMLAADGAVARSKSGSSTDGSEQKAPAENALTTFAFNTGAPFNGQSITGIRVMIRGGADPSGNAGRVAGYYFYVKSGSKVTPVTFGEFGSKNMHNNWHGGLMDTMGVAWVTSDLTNIQVIVGKTGTGSRQRLMIDYVTLDVYFQSSTLNLNGTPFRVVTYRDQVGDTVSEPAKGVPPEANTGDLFQGSLVLNDLTDETAIRFSLPGEPESFPKPYVMRFNSTKRKDRVTLVRTLGQVLIVGMENGIKRVNYLPTEQDTDFHEGLAHDDIATDHGIPGPLAAVKFDWPGRGTVMAYASIAGVFMTDGITTKPLNNDLDWPNTVKLSALNSCVMRVYPREKWLVLYYCPAGATHTKNTAALVFTYAQDHVKNGDELPATGPIDVSGRASTEVVLNGYMFLFTGHETNGFVYQEDYGVTQASGYQVHDANGSLANAPIIPFVRMRRMYPAGITHDAHLYKAYLLFSAFGSAATTASSTTVAGSATLTSSAAFGSVVAGMRVSGAGIDAGTIVKSVESTSSLTLSRAANASGTATLTFDTGTVAVTDRGASIGEAAAGMSVLYGTTTTGDMLVLQLDDTRQGLELQIEKVPLTFTTNADGYRFDTATWADLSVNMRLHQAMILYDDQGPEQSRLAA